MNTLTLESWIKPSNDASATLVGNTHFRVSEECRILLEEAEEHLQQSHEPEAFIPVDISSMELELPKACGQLADCHYRVYLRSSDDRGQFHLTGHRAEDNSLVYTSAVLIAQLG